MGEYLAQRRAGTTRRLDDLRSELGEAERIARERACVYVTGSFGRIEAGKNSDLDVFIVGRTKDDRRALSRLDEICMKHERAFRNRVGTPLWTLAWAASARSSSVAKSRSQASTLGVMSACQSGGTIATSRGA